MTPLGLNATTGRRLTGLAHIEQSIRDILATPVGTRVMRRDYGSHIPDLIDQPMNGATLLRLSAAAFVAVRRWEPRVRVTALRFGVGAVAGQLTAAIDVALVDSGTRQTLNIAIGTR